jgi:glycosyltransferase involved in cell wall biosynthesis
MNLLIFPQYGYPANHAVVNTVYEDLLPARGHVVHMVRPMAGVSRLQRIPAPWPNGSMVVYPDLPTGGRAGNLLRALRRSRWEAGALRHLHDVPLDAIVVRNDLLSASLGAREARRRGIPLVYQLSSPDAEFVMSMGRARAGLEGAYLRLRGRYGLAARRRMSRRASAVLAISDAMRDHLVAEDGLDPAKVFAFPMGVLDEQASSEDVEALCRRLDLPRGRTLVYSGVLDALRQPEWLLDVLDRVRARLPGAALLVITYQTDDRRRAFEEDVRRRGTDVRVVGPVPFRDVPTYLRCADLLVAAYPPMMEHRISSPTKSLEALRAGVPVVGSIEIDEHVAIFEASGGGVAVDYDQARFADAIVSLLEDPDRRRRMGERGRRWVLEHRTYSHLTEYLERILDAARQPAMLGALPHRP